MTTPVKYHCFIEDVAEKVHNLGSDSTKIALTNRAPVIATDGGFADISEIAAGNGYSAGGVSCSVASSLQSAGAYKLTLNDPAVITASGGAIGPFRYAVHYNDTSAGKRLIQYWDYGTPITLQVGETFTIDLSAANGVLQGS